MLIKKKRKDYYTIHDDDDLLLPTWHSNSRISIIRGESQEIPGSIPTVQGREGRPIAVEISRGRLGSGVGRWIFFGESISLQLIRSSHWWIRTDERGKI